MQQLEAHDLLTDSQHGFRGKRSYEAQLMTVVDELLQGMAKGR